MVRRVVEILLFVVVLTKIMDTTTGDPVIVTQVKLRYLHLVVIGIHAAVLSAGIELVLCIKDMLVTKHAVAADLPEDVVVGDG